jgi:TetR/AcrR family transcriptional regulator, cholesterol catabolism regulator
MRGKSIIQSINREKEREIYRIAATLFNKYGYAATSIRQICKTIGIRESSLYHYIHGKEDLLYLICKSAMTQSLEAIEPIARSDMEREQKLRKLIESHIIIIADNVHEHATLLKEIRSLSIEKQQEIIKLRDKYEGTFRQTVGEYLGENPACKKNIKMLTFGLLGMMNWLIYWYSERGEMKSHTIAKIFWELFSHGACP